MKAVDRRLLSGAFKTTCVCMALLAIPSVWLFGWPGLIIPAAVGAATMLIVAMLIWGMK